MVNKKLTILLVSQEYPPETARGGIGTQTFTKAHGLASLGHRVIVLSRSIDNKRSEKAQGNITVIRIPGMEDKIVDMTEPVQWITHSVVVAAEIEFLLTRLKIDIIDFPEWAAEGYTFLLNRTDWNTVPVVIQLHGSLVMFTHVLDWPEKSSSFYKVGTHMEATCVQLADAVYSSSNCSAEWLRKYYGINDQNIPVIHLGVDTEIFSPQKVSKYDHPTIIFTGKIVRNKGIFELLEAAIKLVNEFPGLRLRILGNGDKSIMEELKKIATMKGAGDLLDFAGYVSKENLPGELCKAHIFVMPSYYEGGPGFSYLEAMACGLPVIGCSGSGVSEIIINGINGILVTPKESVELEHAIRKILSDKDFADRLGNHARQYVTEEADSTECLKKLEAFYYSVVDNNSQLKPGIKLSAQAI